MIETIQPCSWADLLGRRGGYMAPPNLGEGENHLWFLPIHGLDTPWASGYLTVDEKKEWQGLRFGPRKREFLLSRGFLRLLLSLYLNVDALELRFERSHFGKPSVKSDGVELSFNLSHTAGGIVVALSSLGEIGVDLEVETAALDDLESLCQRFLRPDETSWILNATEQTDRHQRFYRVFVQKEARLKCLGTGLSTPLDSFSVPLSLEPMVNAHSICGRIEGEHPWSWAAFCDRPCSGWKQFFLTV